jgi:hypothetical protein
MSKKQELDQADAAICEARQFAEVAGHTTLAASLSKARRIILELRAAERSKLGNIVALELEE